MKKISILLFCAVLNTALHAQKGLTYTQIFDSLFINVQQTDATTGILYDRIVPFADLHRLNATDTITAGGFIQAYSERQ
jgi:hypothetical protein